MKKILFCGCSYVKGTGFELEKNEPNLWVNLMHKHRFNDFLLINSSLEGRSNSGIFQDAVFNLTNDAYEYAFVCWTSMPRYELSLGLETYATRAVFSTVINQIDHNLNDINYSKKYLQEISDRFTTLAHLHHEILNLLYYVNSLVNLSKKISTKIYFINSLCPWDLNYFLKLEDVLPDNYTNFTKKIINVDNRDDRQCYDLYQKIHLEYAHAGGIQEKHWLNLYQSLRSIQIDTNNDNRHSGIKSNHLFFDILNKSF